MNKKYFLFLVLAFSVNVHAVDFETEPNNSIKEADPIFNGVALKGHFTTKDNDWFFFDTLGSDVLKLTTPGEILQVEIYNENDILLLQGRRNSIQVGLASAGRYFIKISEYIFSDYSITMSLANTEPHSVSPLSCAESEHAKYDGGTGALIIPAVDVNEPFGGVATYSVTMQLKPDSDNKLWFEVSKATPK